MSNQPRDPKNGPGFEQDLERLRDEWDRMHRAEPPDLLDQAVRNAARRDLEPRRRGRPLRWLGGFATATVAVLALTLMFEQEPQTPVPSLQEPEGLRLEKQSAEPRQGTDAAVSEQAQLPAAKPRSMAREARREALPAQSFSESRADAAGAAADQPARMEPGMQAAAPPTEAMPKAAIAEVLAEEETLPPPEAWIEDLLALKQAGRQTELAAGLAAFREAYPEYPLPAELADASQ